MSCLIGFEDLLRYGKSNAGTAEIEKSFSSDIILREGLQSAFVNSESAYFGENAPHIYFDITVNNQEEPLYRSHSYIIGDKEAFKAQSWRIPTLFLPDMKLRVNVDIPEGTVLSIRDFDLSDDSCPKNYNNNNLRHNAHLGFWGMAPDNTMPAFELAAKAGFSVCIVVPKLTKDGVIVCIHDDKINRTARDKDGNEPEEAVYVWDKTYKELLEWEYGSYKNEIYKGTKIPRLDEFFDLCKKTGMSPMFSTHPGLPLEKWKEVRVMLEERGLLENFHIKSFGLDILKTAYSVFGTDIDGYTFDTREFRKELIYDFLSLGIDKSKCRLGFEGPFGKYTREIAEEITKNGLFASAYKIKQRSTEEYLKLISWGVTEFTEDYHCSMGLNW